MVARAIAVVALAAIAFASVASAQTFCEYYTGALFNNATDPTLQYGLINAVVTRAATGYSAFNAANNVTGLFNDALNKGYFNGTLPPNINYLASDQTTALTTLVTHLDQFFAFALGCRAAIMVPAYKWNQVSLYTLHKNMNINYPTMLAFITQVGASLASYGVTLGSATDPSSEFAYVLGLFSQFNRYPGANNFQICTDTTTCPLAHQIAQFVVNADNSVSQLGSASTTANIAVGDYVNFRFPTTGGITEAASATGTTAKSGGIATATNTHTYTTQMNTAGTYYFYSNNAASTGRITVNVGGMSGGAAATASLGFAAVLAVAVAAAAVVA